MKWTHSVTLPYYCNCHICCNLPQLCNCKTFCQNCSFFSVTIFCITVVTFPHNCKCTVCLKNVTLCLSAFYLTPVKLLHILYIYPTCLKVVTISKLKILIENTFQMIKKLLVSLVSEHKELYESDFKNVKKRELLWRINGNQLRSDGQLHFILPSCVPGFLFFIKHHLTPRNDFESSLSLWNAIFLCWR